MSVYSLIIQVRNFMREGIAIRPSNNFHCADDPDGTQLHAALSTDHRSYCGWKINCCDLSLLSLARVPNDVEIGHFKTSLTSLLDNALSPVLEKLNLVLPSPMVIIYYCNSAWNLSNHIF